MEESDDDELDWDPDRERLRRRVQAHLRVMSGDDDGCEPQRRSIADRRALWRRAKDAALQRSVATILADDAAGDAGSAPPTERSSGSAWGAGSSDDEADVWSIDSTGASDSRARGAGLCTRPRTTNKHNATAPPPPTAPALHTSQTHAPHKRQGSYIRTTELVVPDGLPGGS